MGAHAHQMENKGESSKLTRRNPRTSGPSGESEGTLRKERKATAEVSLPLQIRRTTEAVTRQQTAAGLATPHRTSHHQGVRQSNQGKQDTYRSGEMDRKYPQDQEEKMEKNCKSLRFTSGLSLVIFSSQSRHSPHLSSCGKTWLEAKQWLNSPPLKSCSRYNNQGSAARPLNIIQQTASHSRVTNTNCILQRIISI